MKHFLLFVGLLCLTTYHNYAQSNTYSLEAADSCTSCYQGFEYDTTFRFVGFAVRCPNIIRELTLDTGIKLDYLYETGLPVSWDTLHNYAIRYSGDASYRFADSMISAFYDSLYYYRNDIKIIASPAMVKIISQQGKSCEHVFSSVHDEIAPTHFLDFNLPLNRLSLATFPDSSAYDTSLAWTHFMKGITVPEFGGTSVLLAGVSRYTNKALYRSEYDSADYAAVMPGVGDSSGLFDLSLTLKVDNTELGTRINIDNSDILVRAVLYRRDTTYNHVDTCKCRFYVPFDSLILKKSDILTNSAIQNKYNNDTTIAFKDFHHTFTLPYYGSLGWDGTVPSADSPGTSCARKCYDRLHYADSVDTAKKHFGADMFEGDFYYNVYTTGKFPVTFLAGRVQKYMMRKIERGDLDDLINTSVNSLIADTALNAIVARFSIKDEPETADMRTLRNMSPKIQRAAMAFDAYGVPHRTDNRGIYINPTSEFGTYPLLSGDLEIKDVKVIHQLTIEQLGMPSAIPIFYANPDSTCTQALYQYFRPMRSMPVQSTTLTDNILIDSMKLTHYTYTKTYDSLSDQMFYYDKIPGRTIMFNRMADHDHYDTLLYRLLQDKMKVLSEGAQGSRSRYKHLRREAVPVQLTVSIQGFYEFNDSKGWQWFNVTGGSRMTTPEEITSQMWATLAAGGEGIFFTGMASDGANIGLFRWVEGTHSQDYYDDLVDDWRHIGDLKRHQPRMYYGMNGRYEATRRCVRHFRDTILPVYMNLDYYNGTRFNLDSQSHFTQFPLIDSLRLLYVHRDSSGAYGFTDSTYEALNKSYMSVTIYDPGPKDTNRTSKYLMLTNLRCWPIDQRQYGSRTAYWDGLRATQDTTSTSSLSGLGAIDVRRPVVSFKGFTPLTDSVDIQRIGSTTKIRVGIDSMVKLDAIEPGWGALYRVTPAPRGVSRYGVAYNNAVHSENPSKDTLSRNRLIVYERDSIIYARMMKPDGTWSPERMISDAADTMPDGSSRAADNLFPAVAKARKDTASWMIVWERRDNQMAGTNTVEALVIDTLDENNIFYSDTIRLRLSSPKTFSGGFTQLTPSVVGVEEGFVVAWSSLSGIEICAVHSIPTEPAFMSPILQVHMPQYRQYGATACSNDSLCLFPTLAYIPNLSTVETQGSTLCENGTCAYMSDTTSAPKELRTVHLAFQQGSTPQIGYDLIGVKFPSDISIAPTIWASKHTEQVSYGIPACSFYHPSIAADSARVGVAFETHLGYYSTSSIVGNKKTWGPMGPVNTSLPVEKWVVTLRFRDPSTEGLHCTSVWGWNSAHYSWTDSSYRFSYPSVTQFPKSTDSSGAVVWFEDTLNGKRSQRYFYRYGDARYWKTGYGAFPTMTLVPNVQTNALKASSSLYREDESRRFSGARIPMGTSWKYVAVMENHPSSSNPLFAVLPNGVIRGNYTITLKTGSCTSPWMAVDIRLRHDDIHPIGGDPITRVDKLPPMFFGPRTTFNEGDIVRTGVFKATDDSVGIEREVSEVDTLTPWLDSIDSTSDVVTYVEVVRANDDWVYWRGDTLSLRSMSQLVKRTLLHVPAADVAALGEDIYVRFRTSISSLPDSTYTTSAGYITEESIEADSVGAYSKRTIQKLPERIASTGGAMSIVVIPNPTRGDAEARFTVKQAGTVEIRVYDVMGRMVIESQRFDIGKSGLYSVPMKIDQLVSGVYTVVIEQNGSQVTTRMSVMR